MTVTGSRYRYSKPSATRFFATFGYAWLTIGLSAGTLLLVVANRGILPFLQQAGWGQAALNRFLVGIAMLFVAGSFLLTLRVVRALYRQSPKSRRIYLALLAIPALLSGLAWSNPARLFSQMAGTKRWTAASFSNEAPTHERLLERCRRYSLDNSRNSTLA